MKYLSLIILSLVFASPVLASEVTGTITTGVSTGVEGIVIEAPTANPPAGTYTALQYVALTASSGSTEIRWTTDGTTPNWTTAGIKYILPIPVDQNLTIKAISCYPNNNSSTVASFAYIVNLPATGGSGGGGITPPPHIAGDITLDGKVDILDFGAMMANWSKTGPNTSDLNGDNKVDILDFALLMANWGK